MIYFPEVWLRLKPDSHKQMTCQGQLMQRMSAVGACGGGRKRYDIAPPARTAGQAKPSCPR